MDKKLREMIASGTGMEEIKTYAIQEQGMRTLKESGVKLVADGVTSMEELVKVAYYE